MLITLLTDFGTGDYFVAAMKGVILSRCPGAVLVDVTHDIPPHDVDAAAFTLLCAYATFPPGTVHVAVVDPGVGSARRPLVASAGGHFFVGPDNGIFSYVFEREADVRVHAVDAERHARQPISPTFHGRDVFAPVAAALARGADPAELGTDTADFVKLDPLRPARQGAALLGRVIHIDRFGNCVTNLTPEDLPARLVEAGRARLEVNGRKIREFRRFYAERGGDGEVFGIWGSAGFLELVADRDSAARALRAKRGDAVTAAFVPD